MRCHTSAARALNRRNSSYLQIRHGLVYGLPQQGPMIVESDYRGFRIEAIAIEAQGAWDAEVRIRRIPSETRARVERWICRRPSAKVAERRAVIRARQSVDALLAAETVA
jgi:hypothetical protein